HGFPLFCFLLLCLLHQTLGIAPLQAMRVTEFMARNHSGIVDEEGNRSDWIELQNESPEAVSLEGWSLSDAPSHPRKWTLPATNLPPGGFLLLFASGKDRRLPGGVLHTNFKLKAKGGYLSLLAPSGAPAAGATGAYPAQRADIAYGIGESGFQPGANSRTGAVEVGMLSHATPGKANNLPADPPLPPPEITPASGYHNGPLTVTSRPPRAASRVVYTTDGSEPLPGVGHEYREPIVLVRSTILRAVAFQAGSLPSEPVDRTYLIPWDVLHQTGAGFPPTWGMREGKPVPADYEMDPEIVGHPSYSNRVEQALHSLPSLSILLSPSDLFDPERGLYSNPMANGPEWERGGAVEWIPADTSPGFHSRCGVRIQGGWNRRPEECPKHSLRLLFKTRTGDGKLRYPLFGDQGMQEFSEVILRGGCNNSWLHWSAEERRHGDYLRDQWMRETYAAMGRVSARGRFVHVYLNGLYWGIYNLVERPAGPFVASRLGGKPSDYDVRNSDKVLEGDTAAWDRLFARVNLGLEAPEALREVESQLDLPGFIDYMLLNHYGANGDYDRSSNWYAARARRPDGKFFFIVWDGERTLEQATNNTLAVDDDQSPLRIFQKLRANPLFRGRFQARARELLGPGGVLSPEIAGARYRRLAADLEPAIVLESARWGDYRRDVHPYKEGPYELYTVEDHWKPEVERILHRFFPLRSATFLEQLRQAGLGGE
ncbi:MAG TPA: hypothetical protein DCM86_05565, partial [Verrucomicrobiales bacterium]|nr:hypothetical protein [Verrucomicrobiales bacterium]